MQLVDVREDGEWQAGHASGATHLGRGVIERDVDEALKASPLPDEPTTAQALEDFLLELRRRRVGARSHTGAPHLALQQTMHRHRSEIVVSVMV